MVKSQREKCSARLQPRAGNSSGEAKKPGPGIIM